MVQLNKNFLAGYSRFKDEPKVNDLKQRIQNYNQLLKSGGIRDRQVSTTNFNGKSALPLIMKRSLAMFTLALLGLPG